MAIEREELRDWHRLFGLLLADFFTGSPFAVEVERDLSQQQQLLDVVIIRRGRGTFRGAFAAACIFPMAVVILGPAFSVRPDRIGLLIVMVLLTGATGAARITWAAS